MEKKPRVLIISYYWPPSGGSGVQRWLKFTKYLPSLGWNPIIYTPSNPEIPTADTSLYNDIPKEAEILTRPIWEPYTFYKQFLGLKKSDRIQTGFVSDKKKSGLAESLAIWIRGNFFIPDARKFWVKPSVSFLADYLKSNPVDVIISTGPPHSMHLIAAQLRKQFDIPWIADFRDPWTEVYYFDELKLTSSSKKKHHQLEKNILQQADAILVVSPSMKTEFAAKTTKPIHVITNGYDAADYEGLPTPKDNRFSIVHIGTFMASQNPLGFFKVIAELIADFPGFERDFVLRFIGKVDHLILETVHKFALDGFVEKVDYLPHNEVVTEQTRAAVLLLSINKVASADRILTGKVFEYIAAGRPILALGNEESDVAKLIEETDSGILCNHDDEEQIRKQILHYYDEWKSGKNFVYGKNKKRYSRESLTKDLVEVLKGVRFEV